MFDGESPTASVGCTTLAFRNKVFTIVVSVEGAWARSSGNFVSLSEHLFVDRDTTESVAMFG